ncbi:hypothetical protein VNO77_13752 [Canavalia gladiata]|uniref:Uncharacterized protein n=1 Tax=Canavalia gladiata TaxID=3824 RepID=A0AAN9M191_CANGL
MKTIVSQTISRDVAGQMLASADLFLVRVKRSLRRSVTNLYDLYVADDLDLHVNRFFRVTSAVASKVLNTPLFSDGLLCFTVE